MNFTMLKLQTLLAAIFLLATLQLNAQTVDVNLDSGPPITLYSDAAMTQPLALNDVIQLGYFSQATEANPFAGTFVALTSAGAGTATTVIGGASGSGAGPGTFAYQDLAFTLASPPPNNQYLALLFYNGTSVANSTLYGGVSDETAIWENPTTSMPTTVNFSLGNTPLVWLGGKVAYTGDALNGGASSTPEPQTTALFLGGLGLLFALHRRLRPGVRVNCPLVQRGVSPAETTVHKLRQEGLLG